MSVERIDDSVDSPWWGEHLHRYLVALQYVRPEMKVLDLACGTGFGTAKLYEQGASRVIGGDNNDEALAGCRKKYAGLIQGGRMEFKKMDATRIEENDDYFDLVVSFETLEHIKDYQSALREYKRVLKKDGILLLSTPNRMISSPNGVIVNPFHVIEFTEEELRSELAHEFTDCKIGGQKYIRYENRSPAIGVIEKFLNLRGVRKLSLGFRNSLMRFFGVNQLYPEPHDYAITFQRGEIERCQTFFAVCRK